MSVSTPLTLDTDDIARLDPKAAIQFFRCLLWAEGASVGIGKHLVCVPDCINVPDGGIDARIKDAEPWDDQFIPVGTTGFQIKASDLEPAQCAKELRRAHKPGEPKPEIKRLLDAGGTYVLVLFANITPEMKARREEAIRSELVNLGYAEAEFRVYTADQLVGFASTFPALVIALKYRDFSFVSYQGWSRHAGVTNPLHFVHDESRQEKARVVREALRNPDGNCRVFRVTGLAGVGKTRFVFELLGEHDLKHRVLYVDDADKFHESSLWSELQENAALSAVVVVDNCDLRQHNRIVEAFEGCGARVAFFTLSYEKGAVPPRSIHIDLEPLARDKIEEIISHHAPKLPSEVGRRLAEFSSGYPRIAVLLCDSYLERADSPPEFVSSVSDDDLINRLVSSAPPHSGEFKTTKSVLTGLSLFEKVGHRGPLQRETRWVAEHMGVTWQDFGEVVSKQKQRGVLQGEYYLYVTPFMLRIHLLREWWRAHGYTKDTFKALISSIPEDSRADMVERLCEHIPYVADTEGGAGFVRDMLGHKGLFADGALLKSEPGSRFFGKLAEAEPASALECLERTVGTWSVGQLMHFTTGRRQVVWALEGIAMWRELFAKGARLLLALGEAENETWSNNASGVFAGLFSLGPGPVAPTEAPPHERLPVLEEALASTSKGRRVLAVRACDNALQTDQFVREVGPEHQGLRRLPNQWRPATRHEVLEAYAGVWNLLRNGIGALTPDEQREAGRVLIHHAHGIGGIPELGETVIATLTELASNIHVGPEAVLRRVVTSLRYGANEFSEDVARQWKNLEQKLTGDDFGSLMRRYVGMNLLEDSYDDAGRRTNRVGEEIGKLAEQATRNPGLLMQELPWLVTSQPHNGHALGEALGKRDTAFSLLPMLLEAQRNAADGGDVVFLGGYFSALFRADRNEWEEQLDALAADTSLAVFVPDLTWRSGMSDRGALRILDLAERGIVGPQHFSIFGYGTTIGGMSESVFRRWIEWLLKRREPPAARIALHLYPIYYLRLAPQQRLPRELTLSLLTHKSLLSPPADTRFDNMAHYDWNEVANAFVGSYGDSSVELADNLLEHFGEDNAVFAGGLSHVPEVLGDITRENPEQAWGLVTKYVRTPLDGRATNILLWLRGSVSHQQEAAWNLMPRDRVLEWVDADVEHRAWMVAYFAPKAVSQSEWRRSLGRDVLVRYGGRNDVRRNLKASFSSGFWVGPSSKHFASEQTALYALLEQEDNEIAGTWLRECISSMDAPIEGARIEEERET